MKCCLAGAAANTGAVVVLGTGAAARTAVTGGGAGSKGNGGISAGALAVWTSRRAAGVRIPSTKFLRSASGQ